MTLSRNNRLAALGLLAIALFLLRDVLFLGGAFYERDLLSVYAPTVQAFVRAVSEGAWPLRDPTTAFGQPLLGNPDAQVAYPPTWLNLIFLPERAYPFIVLLHYLIGSLGAAALAWRFFRSSAGSFLAGGFWLASGPFQSFLNVWHHLAGAAWMPWVLVAFDRLLEKSDRRAVFLLGALFGMQILAGSAEMCALTLGLACLRLVCEGLEAPRERVFSQLKAGLLAVAVAAGLGAATWLTAAGVLASSVRTALPEDVRTHWSTHPLVMTEMALPLGLGLMDLSADARSVLFDGREPFVKSMYLGPLILPLLLGGLLSPKIPLKYRVFVGFGVVAAGLMALGKHSPVYGFVTTLLPPLKIFRFPSKAVIPVSLLISALAGAAVPAIEGDQARRVVRASALVLILVHAALWFGAAPFLPAVLNSSDPGIQAMEVERLGRSLLVCLAPLVLLSLPPAVTRSRGVLTACLAGLAVTLFLNLGLNPVVARSVLRYRPDPLEGVTPSAPSRIYVEDYLHFPERSLRFLDRDSPFLALEAGDLPRMVAQIVAFRAARMPPVGGDWGLEYAWDMDLRGLFRGPLRELTTELRQLDGTPAFLRMLRIANVSQVAALHTSTFGQLRLERVIKTPFPEPLYVFKVPDFLPRAYAVSGTTVLRDEDAARELLAPSFNPDQSVILDAGTPLPPSANFRSRVAISSRRSDRIAVDVSLNEPGVVVLLEGFLPGWRVTVDEKPVPVRRANALFLAVPAAPGEHRIVFTYRPWTALAGLALTLLTAMALALGLSRPAKF